MSEVRIRRYSAGDCRAIADLFHESIHTVGGAYYTEAQLEAWSPAPVDYAHWRARLDTKRPFVALIDGVIAGFIELDPDGHIDCMYTHKDFQRQGVATALYSHLLAEARRRGLSRLYVDASHFARPFFEKQGFRVRRKQEVLRRGQYLTNFRMERDLDSP